MRSTCAALLMLFCASAASAADKQAASGNWLTRLFGGKAKTPEPKKDAPKQPKVDAAAPKVALNDARKKYMQRVQVCDKLREIALQTGDDALARRADQLEDRVWGAYRTQLERLSTSSGNVSLNEESLDSALGIDAPRDARPAVSPSAGAGRAAPAPGLAGRK